MTRSINLRAPRPLTLSALSALISVLGCSAVYGQEGAVVANSAAVPAASPAWLTEPAAYQIGPDGAVYLGQPIALPPMGAGTPVMVPAGNAPLNVSGPNSASSPWAPLSPAAPGYSIDGVPAGQPYYIQPGGWAAPQPMPCQPVAVPPPLTCSVWADVLWLHPTGADVAHAQQQDGLGGVGTVPIGRIGVADPQYELGFRVGGEMRFAPKESSFVSFAWFQSNAVSSLPAPVIPAGVGAVGSLVHHPGAALTASIGPVDAVYDVDFLLGDAAYRYFVACSRSGELTVFAGGRFGQLQQTFSQQGIFGGGAGGAIDTTSNIDFNGGGPIAGVTGEHLIGTTSFSVYGRALIAALAGSFRSHYRMFNTTTATLLAESIWEDDRIVPMLDYELGIAWTSPQGHVRIAAGYLASHWFNAVTTPVFIDAVQADNYVDVGDSVSFDGLVGRAEVRW